MCKKDSDNSRYKKNKCYFKKINKLTYYRNRDFLISFLKKNQCIDCGEKDIEVLDFDHVKEKKYSVASMSYNSIKTIKKEIEKCVIRCSNCHRRKTAKENKWKKIS
jgi:5-methylcytosine-specific restriction endonuclease McrA